MIPIFEDYKVAQSTILKRRSFDDIAVAPHIQAGLDKHFGAGTTPAQAVEKILNDIQAQGDSAVKSYSAAFDQTEISDLEVTQDEIKAAYTKVSSDVIKSLRLAADSIEKFHSKQTKQSWIDFSPEGALGQIVRPLERVGIYAPAGTAPLPSSLLMAAIPARVAGVSEIICCSPPQKDTGNISPLVLVAADIAGIHRIFKIGGAQAIGAMAYGTETVPQVDKIAGPGNLFVVLAKRAVYGNVGIEALPGPTETLVIADGSANPSICAADLLAQAEHDTLASAILLTTSADLAIKVQKEVEFQLEKLDRKAIAEKSITNQSGIVLVPDLEKAFELSNAYAPEHLCLLINEPWDWIGYVKNAGGIFLGETSFEVLGDYVAGPSHIMPTGGTARFTSPVNVDDFRKIISLVGLNKNALKRIGPAAANLAMAEGLQAHAEAVKKRFEAEKDGSHENR